MGKTWATPRGPSGMGHDGPMLTCLAPWFSVSALREIERVFEAAYDGSIRTFMRAEGVQPTEAACPRMKAIMLNIIRNGGDFDAPEWARD